MQQPKQRSWIRLFLGYWYFLIKKHLYWYFSKTIFARQEHRAHLPYTVFQHASPLLRQLKGVDMWMQYNKVQNLRCALPTLNGLILKPGETFSYWRLLGRPTKRKGYAAGMILRNGHVTAGIGGGLCQLSNLLYWMTLHTPLTVTERWRHSYDVFPDAKRTQPFGSGATCSYPNIDLQIHNTTNQTFQLALELTDTHLVGAWLSDEPVPHSYHIEERHPHIEHEWWGGYTRHNTLVRIKREKHTGAFVGEEEVCQNHAIMMYQPFLTS